MAALQHEWLRRGLVACALWPLSLAYGAITSMRRSLFASGIVATQGAPVPVVVVGNVVAGGSGKTPIVEAIVQHLSDRGIRAGIVSRGYGRRGGECREVRPGNDPRLVGDEPLLLARSCGVPVFVAARRPEAVACLLQRHPQTQVIVSDDGLQHLAMARDLEICVFDRRGTGNGWLLPAGPLREPWPRHADFVMVAEGSTGVDGYVVRRGLSNELLKSDGTTLPADALRGETVAAVAGIGLPEAFFAMLEAKGLKIGSRLALPDHADFAGVSLPPGRLVCTMKDAVKLWRVRPDALAAPLALEIDPPFWEDFDRALDAKLSSRDGPQTA